MKITESTYTLNKNGGLRIPAAAMRDMGLKAGDHVRVAYLTSDGRHNDYREFLIADAESDEADTDTECQISIPARLLAEANIPLDADVQVVCLNGCIAIYRDDALTTGELSDILSGLKSASGLFNHIPAGLDLGQIAEQLKESIETITEEGEHE